jgi:hypothetical protein
VALFSGFNSFSKVPFGNALNAASVGANTVNGPLADKVSTKPAALIAATKVVKELLPLATSTIVPTVCVLVWGVAGFAAGLFPAKAGTLTKRVVAAMAILTVLVNREFIVFHG